MTYLGMPTKIYFLIYIPILIFLSFETVIFYKNGNYNFAGGMFLLLILFWIFMFFKFGILYVVQEKTKNRKNFFNVCL